MSHPVDPSQVFLKLNPDDGHDQILRQAMIDVLRPGSLSQGKEAMDLLDYRQGLI